MLCLSRKVGEEIVIADNIVVTVSSIDGARVQLAINAPREILIRRAELTIVGASKSARQLPPDAL